MAHASAPGEMSARATYALHVCERRITQQLQFAYQHDTSWVRHDLLPDIRKLIDLAADVQRKAGIAYRFHLLMERDVFGNSVQQLEAGTMPEVETRILFSPTISVGDDALSDMAEKVISSSTILSLRELQRSLNPQAQQPLSNPAVNVNNANASIPPPTSADANLVPVFPPLPEHLPARETSENQTLLREASVALHGIPLPSWVPGKEITNITDLASSSLEVSREVARMFLSKSKKATIWLYRTFFNVFYIFTRRHNPAYSYRSKVYSAFTPPWFKKRIMIGNKAVFLSKVAVPDLRHMRSVMGYRKMALILAAFYEQERFGKALLDVLLRHSDTMPELEEERDVQEGTRNWQSLSHQERTERAVVNRRTRAMTHSSAQSSAQQGVDLTQSVHVAERMSVDTDDTPHSDNPLPPNVPPRDSVADDAPRLPPLPERQQQHTAGKSISVRPGRDVVGDDVVRQPVEVLHAHDLAVQANLQHQRHAAEQEGRTQ